MRGFNQAAEIAARLSSLTGLAVSDCLLREGPPTRQVGRDRAGRAAEHRRPRRAAPGRACRPGSVLLVDDVITTGSTIAACAAALQDAGARHVGALSYARTIGR